MSSYAHSVAPGDRDHERSAEMPVPSLGAHRPTPSVELKHFQPDVGLGPKSAARRHFQHNGSDVRKITGIHRARNDRFRRCNTWPRASALATSRSRRPSTPRYALATNPVAGASSPDRAEHGHRFGDITASLDLAGPNACLCTRPNSADDVRPTYP